MEHGEKPSKYFCSLEKRNDVTKALTMLIDNKNNVLETQKQIEKEVVDFYKTLYTSRDDELINVDLNEILGILVRNNKNIKGIKIYCNEFKISQFADDTTLLLDWCEQTLIASMETLQYFTNHRYAQITFGKMCYSYGHCF